MIKKNLCLKTYKKQKIPKYQRDQNQIAKKGCVKIYRNLCDKDKNFVLIIDDETYINQDPDQIKLQRHYRAKSKNDITDEHRFQPTQKFAKKYMIWQAIDSNGLF